MIKSLSSLTHAKKSPLITIVTISGFLLISTLLCAGLCPITVNSTSGTYPPFVKAAQQGDIPTAEQLLKSGELVNQKTIGDQTPLHIAAAEGQDAIVRWLLAHEANPLAKDQNGKTPADFAQSQGHNQTAQIILDYIQLVKSEESATAAGDKETLRRLLTQDIRKYTVLHIAAQAGATQIVADEIKTGADVKAQTVNGLTPLHKAIVSGKIEIVKKLLDAGANVNARDIYNNTPLYYAINYEDVEMIKLLLATGADLSIRSVWGNETALDFAKRRGNTKIIALLEQK